MSEDKNAAFNMAMLAGGMYGPNKYSQFPNGIQGTSYAGMPTDAHGNPIQMPPGMTLNSTPAAPPPQTPMQTSRLEPLGSPARAMQNAGYGDWGMLDSTLAHSTIPGQTGEPGSVAYQEANYDKTGPQMMTLGHPMATALNGGADPSAAAPQAAAPAGNSYQTALAMLSNPGHVTTPGANVPASQPITNQPSVLDQFLQNQKGNAAGGAGGYSNQGFFDTLNRLKAGSSGAVA